MSSLKFHSKFIFRTPMLPFPGSTDRIEDFVLRNDFQEAIYLASPTLFYEMKRWLKGDLNEKDAERILFSLNKYLSRMQSRSTPYGLFASCSVGRWGTKNTFVIENSSNRVTRLDMSIVAILSNHISKNPLVKKYLLFYPNSSIYPLGEQYRYVETIYSGNRTKHNISSVDKSEYLDKIINSARSGATISDLALLLVGKDVKLHDAVQFIEEVIETQVLVSEFEPWLTGEENVTRVACRLKEIYNTTNDVTVLEYLNLLEDINNSIRELDLNEGNDTTKYYKIISRLKEHKIPLEEKNVFQVDSYRNSRDITLNSVIQEKIEKTIEFLRGINSPHINQDLVNFKARFKELYEEREVPLLEVLDSETGIGYPLRENPGINPLVEDIPFLQKHGQGAHSTGNQVEIILKHLLRGLKEDAYVVQFSKTDISHIPKSNAALPISIPVWFKVIDPTNNKIQIKLIGGASSASNLIARFALRNSELGQTVSEIAEFENAITKDKLRAEIIHLPEDRVGNILFRPVMREFEIPYLAQSSVGKENQLYLKDITLSIKNGRFVIWSKNQKQEITPCLSTAHNYAYSSLPVYKFLCDLQFQDIQQTALLFNWGSLSETLKFLPRAEYEDVVMYPATWNLDEEDLKTISALNDSSKLIEELKNWRSKLKMPRYTLLKDSDNELLIDFECLISIRTFLNTVKKRKSIQVCELIFDSKNSLVKNAEGKSFTHEIIGILLNDGVHQSSSFVKGSNSIDSMERSFIPGSEWMYYKIYCGIKTADILLATAVHNLFSYLNGKGLIEKWFFIRYSDPDPHIRLRFLSKNINKRYEIQKEVFNALQPLFEQGHIRRIGTDTYIRELERYGKSTMEICESVFHIDSIISLEIVKQTQGYKEDLYRYFYSMKLFEDLLDVFGLGKEEKISFSRKLKEGFFSEHGGQKNLKVALDLKFRTLRKQLDGLSENGLNHIPNSSHIQELLNWRKAQLKNIAERILELKKENKLEVELLDLLASFSHMTTNRIFKARQRTYELLIYDLFYKQQRSQLARSQ